MKVLYDGISPRVTVVECPPAYRTVTWRDSIGRDRRYRLNFPYCVFQVSGVGLFNLRTYWRPEPVTGPDDRMYMAAMPNTLRDGAVCLERRLGSVDIITDYWSSVFTSSWSGIICSAMSVKQPLDDTSAIVAAYFEQWAEDTRNGVPRKLREGRYKYADLIRGGKK